MSDAPISLAVVALHPIQYQAGLWRALARDPRFDAHVIYLDRVGIDGSIDPTMNAPMKWDLPVLEGHEHEFVRNWSPFRFTPVVNRVNPGLGARLRARRYEFAIVHGYTTFSNWLALLAARRAGTRLVYRGEGSLRGGAKHDHPLVNAAKHPANAAYLRACDAIAYSSLDNRAYLLSRGAPEERLFSMPCAVDNEALEALRDGAAPPAEFRRRHGIPADGSLVLTVGRFTENKRVGDCIAALAAAPLRERSDVRLAIAGDGPLRPRLEAQVREAGLEGRVHFLGFLNQSAIVEAVLAADLFVLASSHGDPSPKALSEAMYLGRAVVCSDGVGTSEELVEPGANGFVYPSRDVDAFAARIAEALADPARLARMGEHSHRAALATDFRAGVDNLAHHLTTLRGRS